MNRGFEPLESYLDSLGSSTTPPTTPPTPPTPPTSPTHSTTTTLKLNILKMGAFLDRGQSFNPTSGSYYHSDMQTARHYIEELVATQQNSPKPLELLNGEWQLVFSSVSHGLFRSSPFFLAVQEAFKKGAETEAFGQDKAQLFFKLHELQTCSWGVSKIGRIAQRIDTSSNTLYSEFDTSLLSLTVFPLIGWAKMFPTFGGSVITKSDIKNYDEQSGKLSLQVDFTASQKVEGLPDLGDFVRKIKVPVGAIWKLLPWNSGRPATCTLTNVYLDDDFRVSIDVDGEYFCYTRPLVERQPYQTN